MNEARSEDKSALPPLANARLDFIYLIDNRLKSKFTTMSL